MAKIAQEWAVVGTLVGCFVGAFAGISAGVQSERAANKEKEVYVTEVSGDTNPDVVIRINTKKHIWLGQEGSELCKRLEDVEAEAVKKLRNEAYQSIRDKVDSEYSKPKEGGQ